MPDENSRFRISLWDIHGYLQEVWLDRVSDTQVVSELNGERSFSFQMPMRDLYYPLIKHRKIIRLHDTQKDNISYKVSSSNSTSITLNGNTGLGLGDYVSIYEHAPEAFVGVISSDVTSAIEGQTVNFSSASGELNENDYVKLIEPVDEEKLISSEYVRSPNSEIIQVSSVTGGTSTTGSFKADLAYTYAKGTVILKPGRSFIGRILNKNGSTVYLSRHDFVPASDSIVSKVNFDTYRIADIQESRSGGTAIASIRCEHITNDLSDSLFFKDTRVDISYASKGPGQIIQDRAGLETIVDSLLYRHVDSSGKPLTTKSFIKGDLRRFTYSKGTLSGSSGDKYLTGDSTADILNSKISSGSKIYIDGLTSPLTVAYIDVASPGYIVLTSALPSAVSSAKYMVVSQGVQSDVNERSGTANITNDYIDNVSFSVRKGDVQAGAIIKISGESEDYKVSHVTSTFSTAGNDYNSSDRIYIDRTLSTTLTGKNITIKSDEREFNVSSMVSSKGVIRQAVEEFSNDKQEIYYFAGEDRSLNIVRKPVPDDRDPTSDLVVQYRDNQTRNLRSVSRDFEISEFGNRIIPQGANSGWVNSESGFKTIIANDITGTVTNSGAHPGSNRFFIEDSSKDFKSLGVIAGVTLTNTSNSSTATIIDVMQASGGSVSYPKIVYYSTGGSILSDSNNYKIEFNPTMTGKSQLKISGGDNKFLRFGDPLQIYRNQKSIEIAEVSQVQVIRGITRYTTAINGTVSAFTDSRSNFSDLDITPGMMVSKTSEDNDAPKHVITSISQVTNSNDTLNIFPSYSSAVLPNTDFRISKLIQVTAQRYESASNVGNPLDYNSDLSKELLVGGTSHDMFGSSSGQGGTGAEFYFGASEVFDYFSYNLETAGTVATANQDVTTPLIWQYCTGYTEATGLTTWADLTFESETIHTDLVSQKQIINFSTEGAGYYTNRFDPPSDWVKSKVVTGSQAQYGSGVLVYAIKVKVNTGVTGNLYSTSPKIQNVKCYPWRKDQLKGGLIRIDSGNSKGATRRITSNTYDTLTINRRFDAPADVIGQTAVVSGEIGNTFIKGFGYRTVNVESSGTDNVVVSDILPNHYYSGGQLTVKTGTAKNQTFTIANNLIDSTENKTKITILGEFNPQPSGSTDGRGGDQVEVFGLPQMVFDKPIQVINVNQKPGSTGSQMVDFYRIIRFSPSDAKWSTDQWVGGYAHISEDGKFQSHRIIANDDRNVFLGDPASKTTNVTTLTNAISDSDTTIQVGDTSSISITSSTNQYLIIEDEVLSVTSISSPNVNVSRGRLNTDAASHIGTSYIHTITLPDDGWKIGDTSYEPSINAKVLLVKETDLNVSVNTAEGLDFSPMYGDDISLVLKESGGPLTVGKHSTNRTFSTVSTENIIGVLPGDSSKFKRNELIFVGAKDISSKLYFNIGRGDQVQGQQATIKKVVSVSSSTNNDFSTTGYSNLIDTTKNFVDEGVTAGMSVRVSDHDLIITNIKNYVTGGTTHINSMIEFGFTNDITIGSGKSYSIDALVLNESLSPIPQPGDHVELIGFVDSLSVRKNEIVEISNNDSSANDPKILYDNSVKKLNKISSVDPRYTVSFVDLYEYDSDAYKYDKYILGDTIKVVDEDITGPGGTNLRVIKESFSPELPADKSHTLEVGRRSRDFIRDDFVTLRQQVRDMDSEIQALKKVTESARCLWWNPTTKSCVKPTPPNAFCESQESNQDGILTREKIQITKLHCQSYQPAIANNVGADQSEIRMFEYVQQITNTAYGDAYTIAVDTDFLLTNKSKAIITDIRITNNIASGIAPGQVTVRLKLDNDGQIVPYKPIAEEVGTGAYIEYKKTNSGDTSDYTARIVLIAIGSKI